MITFHGLKDTRYLDSETGSCHPPFLKFRLRHEARLWPDHCAMWVLFMVIVESLSLPYCPRV